MNYFILFTYFTVCILCCDGQRWYLRPDFHFPGREPKIIILLESHDPKHAEINNKFCDLLMLSPIGYRCTPKYEEDDILYYYNPFQTRVVRQKIYGGITETINVSNNNPKKPVLNLRVYDFFTVNYKKFNNLKFIIDEHSISEREKKQKVCKVNRTIIENRQPCEVIEESIKNVIIFNDLIENDVEFMNVIEKFIAVKPIYIVLICGYNNLDLKISIPKFQVIYTEKINCTQKIKQYKKNLFLVVTKENTYNIDYITKVPILFTKVDHTNEENYRITPNGIYPNVIKQNAVKAAIIKFLLEMDWQRVAILSDNCLDSHIFRNKLIKEMDNHNMVYYETELTSKKKKQEDNFSVILKSLQEKFARIIIANVQENNVKYLIQAINDVEMFSPTYIWIFRVSHSKHSNLINAHTDVFYVSFNDTDPNIGLKALNSLIMNPYNEDMTEHYGYVVRKANERYSTFKAWIVQLGAQTDQIVLEMDIKNGEVKNADKLASPYTELPTDKPHCIMRNYKFLDCDDDLLLVLVSVISIFVLFIAIIFLYFDDLRTNNLYLAMESNFTE